MQKIFLSLVLSILILFQSSGCASLGPGPGEEVSQEYFDSLYTYQVFPTHFELVSRDPYKYSVTSIILVMKGDEVVGSYERVETIEGQVRGFNSFKADFHPNTNDLWCWDLDPFDQPLSKIGYRCNGRQWGLIMVVDPLLENGRGTEISRKDIFTTP